MSGQPNEPIRRPSTDSADDGNEQQSGLSDSALNSDPFAKTVGPETSDPATKSPNVDPVPESLGRYRIDQKIGDGAFGAVYLGYDAQLDRKV